MSCAGPPIRTTSIARRVPVFSKGGTAPATSDIFVLSPEELDQLAPMLAGIRVTIKVENATANFQSEVVFQTTDDGCTWGDGSTIDAVISLEGGTPVAGNRETTTNWYTTPSNFLRGVRIGVVASQESGTQLEQAWISMVVDFLLRS